MCKTKSWMNKTNNDVKIKNESWEMKIVRNKIKSFKKKKQKEKEKSNIKRVSNDKKKQKAKS